MGRKFKNSSEAIAALRNQGWNIEKTTKHSKLSHSLFQGKLSVPKKHKYLSDEVENSILKAMKEVENKVKGDKK